MCSIDGDRPDVYNEMRIKSARKPHKCEECTRIINVGEPYRRAFMVYDGLVSVFLTCQHCSIGHNWLSENCGGFMHGGLHEEMEGHIREYPDIAAGLLRIKVGMRRRWQRFDKSGLMAIPLMPRPIRADAAA